MAYFQLGEAVVAVLQLVFIIAFTSYVGSLLYLSLEAEERDKPKNQSAEEVCIGGHIYYQTEEGIAPAYTRQSQVKRCGQLLKPCYLGDNHAPI